MTLYRHFPSKEALFEGLVTATCESMRQGLENAKNQFNAQLDALGLFPLFTSIRAAIRAHVLFTKAEQTKDNRRIVEHRVVFDTLRARHIRYAGEPFFLRGHYVVRSYDRFGHVIFVEINPYTGGYIGFVRL